MMIEMFVAGLGVDSLSGQPILVLNDATKQRVLPIWIGVAECAAIGMALGEAKPARPFTHDLMVNMIDELGWEIQQVEVNEISADTYFATIRLLPRGNMPAFPRAIDARPSDAIALAVRTGAPIYVSPEVVHDATIPADIEKDAAEAEEFRTFVQDLKASDFNNQLGL